ncbi:MAG TPA: ATP-binding protein [Methylibium sp.]|nr:ATP-binding protein [Methylibium sp.]
MDKALLDFMATEGFLPHGYCFQWSPGLLGTMVAADAVIAAAYYSIPVALLVFVRRRTDLHFNWIFILFSAFIFWCGTTHLVDILVIWRPDYWLQAGTKAVTAGVSIITAVLLWPLIPKALELPSTTELERLVARLETEVHDRRVAEARLDELNRELERRVAERTRQLEAETAERMRLQDVERAREAAELASRAKSQFLSRVSHELRTPLNGVLGFGQLLKADGDQLSPRHRVWVEHIESSGRQLLNLVDDVLDVSRIEAGGLRLDDQRFELDQLVRDCEAELKATAEAEQVQVKVDAMPARTAWRGDVQRLRQVLTNLLSNAIKYNRPCGEVHIEAQAATGRGVRLEICDTGIGIPADQQEQLFQPFNRLGRERSSVPGTGLGLVVVKQLVEAMGGSIEIASRPGEGTCVTLNLPLAPA